jgi:AcrR family transcriptional regulator
MGSDPFPQPAQGIRDEEILRAALKMFGERGQLMRIEDVTTAVGIGKGTLYRHYASRVNLLRAALAYGIRELQARALAARDTVRNAHGSREQELTAVIGELAAMNARHEAVSPAALCRLRTCEQWTVPLDAPSEPRSALDPLIVEWQADGLLDTSVTPAWMTTIVFGAIDAPPFAADSNGQIAALADRVCAIVRRAFPGR